MASISPHFSSRDALIPCFIYLFNIYPVFFHSLLYFLLCLVSAFNLDIFYMLSDVSNLILYSILNFSD